MSSQNFFNYEDIARINKELKEEYKKLEVINEDIITMCNEIESGSAWNGIGSNNFSEKLKNNVNKNKIELEKISAFATKIDMVTTAYKGLEIGSNASLGKVTTSQNGIAPEETADFYAANRASNNTSSGIAPEETADFYAANRASNNTSSGVAPEETADFYAANRASNNTSSGVAPEETADFYAANRASNNTSSGVAPEETADFYSNNK